MKPHVDVIVSRHPAAVEFIKQQTDASDAVVMAEVSAKDVEGKIVAGNLPLNLASTAKRIEAIVFDGNPPRGQEYTLEDMYQAGARLESYTVYRSEQLADMVASESCQAVGSWVAGYSSCPSDQEDETTNNSFVGGMIALRNKQDRTTEELKLCYVERPWAYFTTQELNEQWGDDWDDAPYEHNAGEPYEYCNYDEGKKPWKIVKVVFDAELYAPCQLLQGDNCNSPYSVEQINNGATDWLRSDKVSIPAGTTYEKFCGIIKECGGKIYEETHHPGEQ